MNVANANGKLIAFIFIGLGVLWAYDSGYINPNVGKPLVGVWYSVFWHKPSALGVINGTSYEHWSDWVRLHPVLGQYSSGDPQVINVYFDQMKEIGVDFIILDYTNGIWIDEQGRTGDRPYMDLNVRSIFEVADTRGDIKVAVAIGGALWMREDVSLHEREADYVWSEFAHRLSYFNFHRKPLLVVYADAFQVVKYMNVWSDERFTVRWASGHAHWILPYAPLGQGSWGWLFTEPYPINREVMGASPGWDTAHLGRATTPIDRENGELFKRMLNRAVDAKPEVIIVSEWDDWSEETAIADSEEWGSLYRDIMKEELAKL